MLMQKAKDPAFWLRVRRDSAYGKMVQLLKSYYRDSRYELIPTLKYSSRARFYGDGDRSEFEDPYFRRRTFLASAALLAMIYPEEQQYLDDAHQILWAICEEYTWALPAHTDGNLADDLTKVDLFNAETGYTLAELCHLLEDRLDKLVLDRARAEVRSRVIKNYQEHSFWWENCTNNWAAVCAGNVGGAMMYLEPEIFRQQLPRLLDTMRSFLSGFPEDGTCLEGIGYWHYGFGNFVWFADLLSQFTDGATDLLSWDKIEAISGYAQRSFLMGGTTVSYSDGTRSGKADRAMVHYLHRRFPDSVRLLPDSCTEYSKGNVTWMQSLRSLLYVDHQAQCPSLRQESFYLPDAGQAVVHKAHYSLAVKAGDNDEPHNHNDIGNFIFATQKGQIFCDLGAGRYTRQYFRDETRYGIFCNSSRSHNVPIVNGAEQLYGKQYRGTMSVQDNQITVEMAGAYGQPDLRKLTRCFLCEENAVILTDSFAPDYGRLTERFVTTIEPRAFGDHVIVGDVKLSFDPGAMTLSVNQEQHDLHGFTDDSETVWCLDFELKPGLDQAGFTICVLNTEEI